MCNRQTISLPPVIMIATEVSDNHQNVHINTCSGCDCIQVKQLILEHSAIITTAIVQTQAMLMEALRLSQLSSTKLASNGD